MVASLKYSSLSAIIFLSAVYFVMPQNMFAQSNSKTHLDNSSAKNRSKGTPIEDTRIKQKKSDLSKLKNEISSLENTLKQKTVKEKETYNVLDNYNKQSYLLHRLIENLKTEEKEKEDQINLTQNNIEDLSVEINALKKNYAKYVVAVYKHGKPDELASILDAESLEQVILRYKYLKKFSDQRVRDISELMNKSEELISAKQNLEEEKNEKVQLEEQKTGEEKNLVIKRNERKIILAAIKNDKTALKSELDAKRNAEIKIQNLISRLIEAAELRKKAEAERLAKEKLKSRTKSLTTSKSELTSKSYNKTNSRGTGVTEENNYDVDLSTSELSSFSALKGRLNWPVNGGRIIRNFGENRNEKLNTVTLNYGVDIKTALDAEVHAVAEGIVSAIDWLPGYGSVLILTHKGDFRTVYSHLSEIFVKEGDRVNSGTAIGKVGESLEGNILHFEIWNSRNKQNPENWLARK